MKKLSCFLCLVMLISFMLPAFTMGGSAAALPVIKGDVNGDGIITVDDAKEIASVCAGKAAVPAAGSAKFVAANVTGGDSDIDMEDVRRVARAARGIVPFESLYQNAALAKTELIAYFNSIANQVKSADFKTANKAVTFSHDATVTEGGNLKSTRYNNVTKKYEIFDLSSLGFNDADLMTGVNENTESYSAPSTVGISNTSYPINGSSSCSTLTAADISSISISVWQEVDLIKGVPHTFNVGSKKCDITTYQNKAAALARCMKITVVLNQETNTSVAKLGSALSAREKLLDSSFRDLVASYPIITNESSGDMTMSMKMNCTDASSNVTAIYYINTTTLKPVAAMYKSNVVINQNVEMQGDIPIVGKLKVSMDAVMTNNTDEYFLFTGAFA